MEEKDFEKDVTIGKVYKGKGGEGHYGPWQIWNFYIDDPDDKRKFTWFEKDGLIPIEGMNIKAMEFEISETHKDGKTFRNHTVKWFKLNSTPNTQPQKSTQGPSASTGGTIRLEGLSFYVSYAKDLMCKAMELNADYGQRAVDALASEVMEIGKDMCRSAMELPGPKQEPEPYKPTLNPDDDYPPIGEPPPL
jgi:hypothetical protein